MTNHDLYSRRMGRHRGDGPEGWIYDLVPQPVRVQVLRAAEDVLGAGGSLRAPWFRTHTFKGKPASSPQLWQAVRDLLRRERGVLRLADGVPDDLPREEVAAALFAEEDAERVVDIIEIIARAVLYTTPADADDGIDLAERALAEMNARFVQAGVGYRLQGAVVVRTDNPRVTDEVVQPMLRFTGAPDYGRANDLLVQAWRLNRHGKGEASLQSAGRALKEMLAAVCARRGVATDPSMTSNALFAIAVDAEILPRWLTREISALNELVTCAVRPPGDGDVLHMPMPHYMTTYALQHVTALVRMVEAAEAASR